jgi:thiol-disulfide isomerase/thioredoxin
MLHRDYDVASRLLRECLTDQAFSKERQWMMSLLADTASDCHPDAQAVRCRLALVCFEAGEAPAWKADRDLDGYFRKYAHVSVGIRMTSAEERSLMKSIPDPTGLRETYLTALDRSREPEVPGGGAAAAATEVVEVEEEKKKEEGDGSVAGGLDFSALLADHGLGDKKAGGGGHAGKGKGKFDFASLFGDSLLRGPGGSEVSTSKELNGKVVALYFSAHWCPPCRQFTPMLAQQAYAQMKKLGYPFEVVFASHDRSEDAFNEYLDDMPWLALPYSEKNGRIAELVERFNPRGAIPSLIIFHRSGKVITTEGVRTIAEDRFGERFPWLPPGFDDDDDGEGDWVPNEDGDGHGEGGGGADGDCTPRLYEPGRDKAKLDGSTMSATANPPPPMGTILQTAYSTAINAAADIESARVAFRYRRPGPDRLHGTGALHMLGDLWDDKTGLEGKKNYYGFNLLYDMLVGRIDVNITREEQDGGNWWAVNDGAAAAALGNADATDAARTEVAMELMNFGLAHLDLDIIKRMLKLCKDDRSKTAQLLMGHPDPAAFLAENETRASTSEIDEEEEGPRRNSTCVQLAKLLVHSMYIKETEGGQKKLEKAQQHQFNMLFVAIHAAEADAAAKARARAVSDIAAFPLFPVMQNMKHLRGDEGFNSSRGQANTFVRGVSAAMTKTAATPSWAARSGKSLGSLDAETSSIPVGVGTIHGSSLRCRPVVSDTRLSKVTITALSNGANGAAGDLLSGQDLEAFAGQPLSSLIRVDHFVGSAPPPEEEAKEGGGGDAVYNEMFDKLPFRLGGTSGGSLSSVARGMVARLDTDLKQSAEKERAKRAGPGKSELRFFGTSAMKSCEEIIQRSSSSSLSSSADYATAMETLSALLERALSDLGELGKDLEQARGEEAGSMLRGIGEALKGADDTGERDADDATELRRLKFLLRRDAGQENSMWFELLVQNLLNTGAETTMQDANPFLPGGRPALLLESLGGTLLRMVRLGQIKRAVGRTWGLAGNLRKLIEGLVWAAVESSGGLKGGDGVYVTDALVSWAVKSRKGHLGKAIAAVSDVSSAARRLEESLAAEKGSSSSTSDLRSAIVVLLQWTSFEVGTAGAAGAAGAAGKADSLEAYLHGFLCSEEAVNHIIDLARRSCCFQGRRLRSPPTASTTSASSSSAGDVPSTSQINTRLRLARHSAAALVGELTARRHFASYGASGGVFKLEMDPRFLVFECLSGFLLRKRQVRRREKNKKRRCDVYYVLETTTSHTLPVASWRLVSFVVSCSHISCCPLLSDVSCVSSLLSA